MDAVSQLNKEHCNDRRDKWAERASESEGGLLHRLRGVVRCVRCKWRFYRLRRGRLRLGESHSAVLPTHHLRQMIVITLSPLARGELKVTGTA